MTMKQKTRVRKIKTVEQSAAKPEVTQAEQHIAAIKANKVPGVTGMFNANRPVKILLDTQKTVDKLTDRSRLAFYALRDAYGNKVFSPRGLDNGIMRDLVASGLVTITGGQESIINGRRYMVDGVSPVKTNVTASGMKYGKA